MGSAVRKGSKPSAVILRSPNFKLTSATPAAAKTMGTNNTQKSVLKLHIKARCELYPLSSVKRFPVLDAKVRWIVDFPEYAPVVYTSPKVLAKPVWADPDLLTVKPEEEIQWNQIDKKKCLSRVSHTGPYEVKDGLPRNPVGRTGIKGRGNLGRWGPNHAADPIVTRWKRDEAGNVVKSKDGRPVLQFIAVQRRDNQQWALPGGMVDAGEVVTETLRREFGEEAMNSLEMNEAQKKQTEKDIDALFHSGKEIYRGYVDDPRNTDNAWMETVALNFHDNDGTSVARLKLHAGDDAMGVKWTDLSGQLDLYASHIDFLEDTAHRLSAFW